MKTIDTFLNEFEVSPSEVDAAQSLRKGLMMAADSTFDKINIQYKQKIKDFLANRKNKSKSNENEDESALEEKDDIARVGARILTGKEKDYYDNVFKDKFKIAPVSTVDDFKKYRNKKFKRKEILNNFKGRIDRHIKKLEKAYHNKLNGVPEKEKIWKQIKNYKNKKAVIISALAALAVTAGAKTYYDKSKGKRAVRNENIVTEISKQLKNRASQKRSSEAWSAMPKMKHVSNELHNAYNKVSKLKMLLATEVGSPRPNIKKIEYFQSELKKLSKFLRKL